MTQQATADADRLLTPEQVCEQLGIQKWKLNQHRRNGDIEGYRIGHRTVRYRQSAVDKFLADRPA